MPRDTHRHIDAKPTQGAMDKAFDLGFDAYVARDFENTFSGRHVGARLFKMDDLAANWQQGYDAAEREARIEFRHKQTLRYGT